MNNTINNTNVSDPWVESGAMVYVALTVATLSAVIMCCTWFIKQRFIRSGYGTLGVTEPCGSGDTDSGEEEDIPLVKTVVELSETFSDDGELDDNSEAFTLEASSSDDEEVLLHENAV